MMEGVFSFVMNYWRVCLTVIGVAIWTMPTIYLGVKFMIGRRGEYNTGKLKGGFFSKLFVYGFCWVMAALWPVTMFLRYIFIKKDIR